MALKSKVVFVEMYNWFCMRVINFYFLFLDQKKQEEEC